MAWGQSPKLLLPQKTDSRPSDPNPPSVTSTTELRIGDPETTHQPSKAQPRPFRPNAARERNVFNDHYGNEPVDPLMMGWILSDLQVVCHPDGLIDGRFQHAEPILLESFGNEAIDRSIDEDTRTDVALNASRVPAILTKSIPAQTRIWNQGDRPRFRKIAVLDPSQLETSDEDLATQDSSPVDESQPIDENIVIDESRLPSKEGIDHIQCGDLGEESHEPSCDIPRRKTGPDESASNEDSSVKIGSPARSPAEPPRLQHPVEEAAPKRLGTGRKLRTPIDPSRTSEPARTIEPEAPKKEASDSGNSPKPLLFKLANTKSNPSGARSPSKETNSSLQPVPKTNVLPEASLDSDPGTPHVSDDGRDPASDTPSDPAIASDNAAEAEDRQASDPSRETHRATPRSLPLLKTADEDMQEYLAEEEPSGSSRSSDRALQGVDAELAKKPNSYGEEGGSQLEPSKPSAAPKRIEITGTPEQQRRMKRVQQCLDHYLTNPETTAARSPWAVMHAVLAFGSEYELIGPKGRVNAIGWMCHNGLCRTQRMFTPRGDSFVPNIGGGVQGHQGQFLAILAQCQVPPDYPIQIGDNAFKVEDLVRYEMATCQENSELTFKLIGLSYYLDSNKQWRANDGKAWNIQKLIQEELKQPIVGAACGGTHRLMGLSFAIKQRVLQGQPVEGQYVRAAKFVNEYINYTWRLQNPDGSFSTNWYESRGNEPKEERKVQTSGHMLEWLMFNVSDSELRSPRVQKAVDFLLNHIYDKRDKKWPIGPRGHATRALALYAARMSEPLDDSKDSAAPSKISPEVTTNVTPKGPAATTSKAGQAPGARVPTAQRPPTSNRSKR